MTSITRNLANRTKKDKAMEMMRLGRGYFTWGEETNAGEAANQPDLSIHIMSLK